MILGIAFLLMVSLVMGALMAALGKWWGGMFTGWAMVAETVNLLITFALTTTVFAMIYKMMPRARVQWQDVWLGALVTSLLFTIGKFLIGIYIGKSGIASGFGAAGSLIIILVWVYYSAQIFLIGAEFTWVYAHTFGSARDEPVADVAAAVAPGGAIISRKTAPPAGKAVHGKSARPALVASSKKQTRMERGWSARRCAATCAAQRTQSASPNASRPRLPAPHVSRGRYPAPDHRHCYRCRRWCGQATATGENVRLGLPVHVAACCYQWWNDAYPPYCCSGECQEASLLHRRVAGQVEQHFIGLPGHLKPVEAAVDPCHCRTGRG
jgi:hypothetical protein